MVNGFVGCTPFAAYADTAHARTLNSASARLAASSASSSRRRRSAYSSWRAWGVRGTGGRRTWHRRFESVLALCGLHRAVQVHRRPVEMKESMHTTC